MTKTELVQMWNRPIERQCNVAISKMLEAIRDTKGEIAISFSGGKDSCLLLDLYADLVRDTPYKDKPIIVNYANTTNETLTMMKFVPWFIDYIQNKYDVTIDFREIRPSKTWVKYTQENGVPIISKQQGRAISTLQKETRKLNFNPDDLVNYMVSDIEAVNKLLELGFSKTAIRYLTGYTFSKNSFSKSRMFCLSKKWLPLVGLDIDICSRCCETIKESGLRRLEKDTNGAYMTGEQAQESAIRTANYIKNGGCNVRLQDGKYKSTPFGAMTQEAILYFIKLRKVPICSDYGEIVTDKNNCLTCTKATRTGCALCGFGVQYDTDRFIRLQEVDPNKVKYAFTPKSEGGAGYLEVITFMNEHCGTNIAIPKI